MDSKSFGEWVEMVFLCEATARGFIVSQPFGDNQPYDFLVDTGDSILRAQVKGVSSMDKGKNRYKVMLRRGRAKTSEYGRGADIFAVYVADMNDWFIIPESDVTGKRSTMAFYDQSSRASSNKYRNNWDIISYYEHKNRKL